MDERCIKSKIEKKMSFLEIKNLNISYQTRKEKIIASQDVQFTLERGEILGIVGESGSGKSTIANAIINLIDSPGEITDGSIKIENIELCKDEEIIQSQRGKKIGFVFQDPQTSLNPILTVGEQLIETIQTHLQLSKEEAKNKSINLLKEVGIFKTSSEARRQIQGGAVRIDGEKIPDPNFEFKDKIMINGKILQVGKKTFRRFNSYN